MLETVHSPNNVSDVGIRPPGYRLPSTAHLGRARLAVSQLQRSVDFYTGVIGLRVVSEEEKIVRLAAHNSAVVLLELEQVAGVQPIGKRSRLGLYHTAFLLAHREALSSFVQHLQALRVPFGSGDHLYSEALYLTDPDGLTVEVYADRPRSEWTVENREIVGATDPVRFATFPVVPANSWQGAPAGTTMGHIHFFVGDLKEASAFYHAGLGLDIVTWRYPGALFTSAGGYHHHVGLNVWAAGSPVAASSDARLLFWELLLPTREDLEGAVNSLSQAGYTIEQEDLATYIVTDSCGITLHLRLDERHR